MSPRELPKDVEVSTIRVGGSIKEGVGTVHNGWHGKGRGAVPAACSGGGCWVTLSGNFTDGNYIIWAEAWGPGGYTFGGDYAGWKSFSFGIFTTSPS